MRIVLFDQINEIHVCSSLAQALTQLGHEVIWTGAVWKGHRFPDTEQEIAGVESRLHEVMQLRPDVLLNFRASSLLPRHVRQARQAGVKTLVWLPDDPVLYGLTYGRIVDEYDIPLHCGNRKILRFYQYQGHRAGVNLPFWLDTGTFEYRYDAQRAEGDAVFFGNMHGPAKRARYEQLCSLHEDLAIYGTVPHDPQRKCKGRVEGTEATVATLSRYRVGLNMAQHFPDYLGSPYHFSGLAMLGHFFLPSRVLQYAAVGLPTLTVQAGEYDVGHYPAGLHAGDLGEARRQLGRLLADPDLLRKISRAGRADVERYFSASSRARMLEHLLLKDVDVQGLTLHEKEYLYKWF